MKSTSNAWQNITGLKFNYLTAITYKGNSFWEVLCDCGSKTIVKTAKLKSGVTKSCGCIKRLNAVKHNGTGTSEYNSWASMKARCNNSNNRNFANYGGRGIQVCKEWENSFAKFIEDMGPCPKGYSIERKDNSLGYYPENCIWASCKTQSLNRRSNIIVTYKGTKYPLKALCELLDLNYKTVFARIRILKWSLDDALHFTTKTEQHATSNDNSGRP